MGEKRLGTGWVGDDLHTPEHGQGHETGKSGVLIEWAFFCDKGGGRPFTKLPHHTSSFTHPTGLQLNKTTPTSGPKTNERGPKLVAMIFTEHGSIYSWEVIIWGWSSKGEKCKNTPHKPRPIQTKKNSLIHTYHLKLDLRSEMETSFQNTLSI